VYSIPGKVEKAVDQKCQFQSPINAASASALTSSKEHQCCYGSILQLKFLQQRCDCQNICDGVKETEVQQRICC
jgi:hypothetical protein